MAAGPATPHRIVPGRCPMPPRLVKTPAALPSRDAGFRASSTLMTRDNGQTPSLRRRPCRSSAATAAPSAFRPSTGHGPAHNHCSAAPRQHRRHHVARISGGRGNLETCAAQLFEGFTPRAEGSAPAAPPRDLRISGPSRSMIFSFVTAASGRMTMTGLPGGRHGGLGHQSTCT